LPPFVEIDFEVTEAREQMKCRHESSAGVIMMPANSEVEAFAMCEAEALPNEVGTVQRIGEVQQGWAGLTRRLAS